MRRLSLHPALIALVGVVAPVTYAHAADYYAGEKRALAEWHL